MNDELTVMYDDQIAQDRMVYPELTPKHLAEDSDSTLIDRYTS
jgi:hypothetical protein